MPEPNDRVANRLSFDSNTGAEESRRVSATPSEQFIQERPELAVGVAIAAGVAIGFGVGAILAGSSNGRRSEYRRLADSMGQRVISALENALPDDISKNLNMTK